MLSLVLPFKNADFMFESTDFCFSLTLKLRPNDFVSFSIYEKYFVRSKSLLLSISEKIEIFAESVQPVKNSQCGTAVKRSFFKKAHA